MKSVIDRIQRHHPVEQVRPLAYAMEIVAVACIVVAVVEIALALFNAR
jgi:hypothetical protein